MKCDEMWLGMVGARNGTNEKYEKEYDETEGDIDQKQLMAKATHALHRNTGQLDVSWDWFSAR